MAAVELILARAAVQVRFAAAREGIVAAPPVH